MDFNSRVVAFLAELGYSEETPDALAATTKGNLRRVWEFVLDRARPTAEARRIEDAVRDWQRRQEADSESASRAARAAALRARLSALRGECDSLERTLEAQQEELRLQTRTVVDESGEAQASGQERQDAELLALALGCYTDRCARLAHLLAQRREGLGAAAVRVRARQQQQQQQQQGRLAASAGPEPPGLLLEDVQQLVTGLRHEMQQALEAREPEVVAASSAPARPRVVSTLTPSAELGAAAAALQPRAPAALLACAAALADRSAGALRALLASGEAAAAAANAAVSLESKELQERRAVMPWTTAPADAALARDGAPPKGQQQQQKGDKRQQQKQQQEDTDVLIRDRQQAHVKLFLEARAAARAAATARARAEQLLAGSPELKSLREADGGAAAALWLAVASLRAEVTALRSHTAALSSEVEERSAAEAALSDQWAEITRMTSDYQRASAVLRALWDEGAALAGELAAQSGAARAALTSGLAPRCRLAGATARGARGSAAGEADAARRLPLAALGAGGAAGPLAMTAPTRLALAAQQLCRAGTSAAGASPSQPSRGAKLSTPAGASPGTPGGGTAATASPGAGAAGGSAQDPGLLAVLEAVCALDDLAPIKCPAGLLAAVEDGARRLQDQQQLLSSLDSQLASAGAQLSEARAGRARLQAAVDSQRAGDAARRLPALEAAAAEGRAALEFAEGPVRGGLTDWAHQPAQHAAPWITYEGRNCSEWLSEVQVIHGRQREITGGQLP